MIKLPPPLSKRLIADLARSIPASAYTSEYAAYFKRSKYGNKKTVVDGITFDSKGEAERWKELRLLERAGEIALLKRQPRFDIEVGPSGKVVGFYKADFEYFDKKAMKTVYEDVKGVRTALYRFKKKCVEAIYGIEITEIEV